MVSIQGKPSEQQMSTQSSFEFVRKWGQVGALAAVWFVADAAARAAHLPVSGSVLGLGVVAALLFAGWLPQSAIEHGAEWLLGDMLLFFVPAIMAVVRYKDLWMDSGIRLAAVIVLGNTCVMLVTASVVEAIVRRKQRPSIGVCVIHGERA
jgi:holin-like protein